MTMPLKLLIVEDFESDALLVARALSKAGFTVQHERVQSLDNLRAALAKQEWDVIVTDYSLPGFDALQTLEVVRESGCRAPVFVVSSRAPEEAVVAVMRAGARDYLRKDHLSQLGDSIRRELAAGETGTLRDHSELRSALGEVIAETDKLLASALPQSLLHSHARRLRDAAGRTLASLPPV